MEENTNKKQEEPKISPPPKQFIEPEFDSKPVGEDWDWAVGGEDNTPDNIDPKLSALKKKA